MIKDNLLEKRLNAVKEGKPIPEVDNKENSLVNKKEDLLNKKETSLKIKAINEVYKLLQTLASSMLYGIGFDALLATEWSFIQMFGVGLLFNHTVFYILSNLLKLFKK